MAIPVLPSQFKPIFGSYSYGGPGGVVRTEVAGGANRYALQFDRGMQKWNVTFHISDSANSAWVAFYHYAIKKGAITFQMNLDSGFGLEPHNVNIVPETYSASSTEFGRHVISFVCEGESSVYRMTEADALALVNLYATYGDGLTDSDVDTILFDLYKFANIDSNVLNF